VTIRWFDPLNEYELDHNYRPDIIMHLKCYVRYADIMNQLKVNNISPKDIGLSFVIQMLLDLGPPDLTVYDVRLHVSCTLLGSCGITFGSSLSRSPFLLKKK